MKKEHKTVAYDETLQIEAYRLDRITQPFPNHFHEYYVIGFVARGGAPSPAKIRSFTSTQAASSSSSPATTTAA